jgi:hypothetical protein
MKRLALGFIVLTSVAQPAPAARPTPPVDGISYTVKLGDTLYDLAHKYLIRVAEYLTLQRSIRLPVAQHLQPGTNVLLPRALLKSVPVDAHVAAFRGPVLINHAPPSVGMAVSEGAQVETAAGAFATLLLSNGSKVTLPSQSSVRLSRMRKYAIDGSLDYEVTVENGRVETKASHFDDPNSRFQFKTPLATSAVRGTAFRVAYAKSGESDSLTEVLGGSVAVGAARGSAPQLIPSGTGAGVSKAGVTRTEQLLPVPAITNANDVQKDDLVAFNLAPVGGAASYHVQLARDAGFVDIFDDIRSATPLARFANVPNGNQFVRAIAVSASGFEGLTESLAFVRKLNSVHAIAEPGGHGGFRFKWTGSGEGPTQYRFQLTRAIGGTPVIDEPGMTTQELELTKLAPGIYFWRVCATQFDKGETNTNWTDFEKLTIAGAK